ncbi:MAG: class I SAM-dependent methyltransferase [Lachnospiraceae bacterium]|nr:class I SAM-dependent methyltransferase [Lachnospiraceae bacterium]
MGIIGKFINQTRKPEGFLGKMMLKGMNSGHAKMAGWAMGYLGDGKVQRAADIGCGGGRNAGELLKKYPAAHVTAVDYSPLSVEKAAEYNKAAIEAGRCTVMEGDVSDLKLDRNAFDLVTAFETVYFWPGLSKCFSNVAGILKEGGRFMIVNESDGTDDTGRKYEKKIEGMKLYTAEVLEKELRAAGFSDVKVHHYEKKPWITVIAEK